MLGWAMTLVIDFSHVHRKITGIERVSLDLFSNEGLKGLLAFHQRAISSFTMITAQWLKLPLRAVMYRKDIFICPGFPPSMLLTLLAKKRLITYVHDLFLIERCQEQNFTARYYMRPSFFYAIRHSKYFLVNSQYTRDELKKYCLPDSVIHLARPPVANAFDLVPFSTSSSNNSMSKGNKSPLRIVCIGTVEPRKNFLYAAQIRKQLAKMSARVVELHIVGRQGWGNDAQILATEENVILHGYCTSDEVRKLISETDLFLSTSRSEGLGLPLLEVQHGGICVIATDIPAYREVLGQSGCLIPLDDAEKAAQKIINLILVEGWREAHSSTALENVINWNKDAEKDKEILLTWLGKMASAEHI